jgi:hypothetical protein
LSCHNIEESKLFEAELEPCTGSGSEIPVHGYYFLHHNCKQSLFNDFVQIYNLKKHHKKERNINETFYYS